MTSVRRDENGCKIWAFGELRKVHHQEVCNEVPTSRKHECHKLTFMDQAHGSAGLDTPIKHVNITVIRSVLMYVVIVCANCILAYMSDIPMGSVVNSCGKHNNNIIYE